jgi:UDP-N-acetylglucosamine acyltransferase
MIHKTAIISETASLHETVEVGAFCVIGDHVTIKANTKLMSHVVIEAHTEIGENCTLHPFCVLGGAPQSTGYKGEPTKLIIGHTNIFREGVTINRGTLTGGGVTRIGNNGFFMTHAHIAHDCLVGDHVIFANNATLAGHCELGNSIFLGGFTAVHQFTRIGDFAMTAATSFVKHDVIPFGMTGGAESTGAKLMGLNIVGMKRRGFSKLEIKAVHDCFKLIFKGDSTYENNLQKANSLYAENEKARLILEFLSYKTKRPIMQARIKGEE